MTKQSDLLAWCVSTFGARSALDPHERAARLVEEAIEVAQAAGLLWWDVWRIADRVYDRPAGGLRQEIGGCAFTLAALAEVAGLNVAYELQREYERVMSIDPEFFRAKNAAKVAAKVAAGTSRRVEEDAVLCVVPGGCSDIGGPCPSCKPDNPSQRNSLVDDVAPHARAPWAWSPGPSK